MMVFSVVVVVVAFIWEEKQFIWTVMPQSYTESPYFSQILKAGLEGTKFHSGSTLLQYVDDLFHFSPSQASSKEDSNHLLKFLAFKGQEVTKEKIAVCPNTGFSFLVFLIPE